MSDPLDRDRELREVPSQMSNSLKWPRGVRAIGMDELDALGIDKDAQLYWHGKRVQLR
jgi:hypothetical protein